MPLLLAGQRTTVWTVRLQVRRPRSSPGFSDSVQGFWTISLCLCKAHSSYHAAPAGGSSALWAEPIDSLLRTRWSISSGFREREGEIFPRGSVVKNPPANARGAGSDPWVGKNPWRRKWQPSPVFLRGKCHGQRSRVGYSPGGPKESDATQHTRVRVKWAFSIFHSTWL